MGKRKGVMLCYPFNEDKIGALLDAYGFVYVQRKYNGERCLWTGGRLLSSEGNERTLLPTLFNEIGKFFNGKALDGEFYVHGMSRQKIRSIVGRTAKMHELEFLIQVHIFDIPAQVPFRQRLEILESQDWGTYKHLFLAETLKAFDLLEIKKMTKRFIDEGYEGSIIRSPEALYTPKTFYDVSPRGQGIYKWKPQYRDKYQLVAMHEGLGKYAGTLGSMTVRDKEGNTFNVGSFALSDEGRYKLWLRKFELENSQPMVVIRYLDLSDENIPPSSTFEVIVGEENGSTATQANPLSDVPE